MKNSNKLLLLLLVLVFLIPALAVMGFKTAIRDQKYVLKNVNGIPETPYIATQPFRVLKVMSVQVPVQLTCHIRQGAQQGYRFRNYDPGQSKDRRVDSCSVDVIGDTLVIAYQLRSGALSSPDHYYHGVELDLRLADGMTIVAEGARIVMDPVQDTCPSNLVFHLSGQSELELMDARHRNTPAKDDAVAEHNISLSHYSISAVGSKLRIHAPVHFAGLNIDAREDAQVAIGSRVLIDTLSGRLSPETIFEGPYRLARRLE